MSKKEKLILRAKSIPSDFNYNELLLFLSFLGFKETTKGKTSGSRVAFIDDKGNKILLHKPHGKSAILKAALKDIVIFLENQELI